MAATVPAFSRVEIRTSDKPTLTAAASALRALAAELELIGSGDLADEQAAILAHHKIKETSQQLRGSGS